LALAILRAEVNAHRIVEARRQGATTKTPPRPANLVVEKPAPAGPKITQLRERWIALSKPGQKAIDDNRLYVGRFIDLNGDIPIDRVTKKMVREFLAALMECPCNPSKEMAGKPLQEQITWAKEIPNCRLLSRQTINAKGFGSLFALMKVAIREDIIDANPCADKKLPLLKNSVLERLAYTLGDLIKIFSSPVYLMGKRWVAGAGRCAGFWGDGFSLLTGFLLMHEGLTATQSVPPSQVIPLRKVRAWGFLSFFAVH
jgi:hypothetical protein